MFRIPTVYALKYNFVLKQGILFTGFEEALLAFAVKTTKTVHIYQPTTYNTVSGM